MKDCFRFIYISLPYINNKYSFHCNDMAVKQCEILTAFIIFTPLLLQLFQYPFFFGGDSITALLKYNLHTMQFIHLKCTIKWFLICSQVVQPSPQPILEYFSYPRKKSCTLQLSPLLPPTHLILRQPLIYFLSVDLPVLEISYKWNHIYSLLCLSYSFFFVGI